MKKILLLSLLFLTACHQKQNVMEDAQPQPEIIEESPTKIETAEKNIAIEEEEEPSVNTLIDSSDYIVNEAQLYLENGLSRHDYETLPHLTIGDQITIQNDDQILGLVSFDKAEIVDDELGSSKKGLVLWFTETNTTNETLEVGLYGQHPLTLMTVFKDDQELKPLSTTPYIMGVENNDYLANYHVEYNNEKVLPCSENTKLLPGESRMCYQIYSYAGKGEYLINQATDLTYENWKSYLLTIE
ncbi:MAG: hypothetical protein ACLVLR_10050 [Turicibacter sanguinis]